MTTPTNGLYLSKNRNVPQYIVASYLGNMPCGNQGGVYGDLDAALSDVGKHPDHQDNYHELAVSVLTGATDEWYAELVTAMHLRVPTTVDPKLHWIAPTTLPPVAAADESPIWLRVWVGTGQTVIARRTSVLHHYDDLWDLETEDGVAFKARTVWTHK